MRSPESTIGVCSSLGIRAGDEELDYRGLNALTLTLGCW